MNPAWRRFRYRAFTGQGDIVEGQFEASSQQAATELLWSRGLTPLETELADLTDTTPWWRRDISWSDAPSTKAVASFTREFAILSGAGLPLDSTLRLLTEQTASKPMKAISNQMIASILSGSAVSEALRQYPKTFGPDYLSVLRAGERSGRLAQALNEIAELLEQRVTIRDKIRSALIYPCILTVMALASVSVIMGALIPSIAPIFAQNGKEPPMIISALLWLQAHWQRVGVLAAGISLAIIMLGILLVKNARSRLMFDRVLLATPIVGTLALNHNTERFSRTLAALLRAGVPILAAFTGAQDVPQNRVLRMELGKAFSALQDGTNLADALGTHTHLPKIAIQMIAIGEASGKLEQMLQRLATNTGHQVQQRIDRLMTLLTPALTVAIAALIGGLVLTTMNAILSINELALQ
ncbi:type II secretion system F family protein [Ensifer adhaerens]|jgi:general secretion pathway protein F|uniref:type II secretion system F family protein n=1 Tax=Rhizobium sp. 11_C7_N12_5 TaxID=3240770 RepID=UPI000DE030C7|nr:Type II secretion system protein F [Ensifer adhaerens]